MFIYHKTLKSYIEVTPTKKENLPLRVRVGRDGLTGDTEPQALYNLGRLTGNLGEGSRAQGRVPRGQRLKADAAQRSREDATVGPATPSSLALRQLNGPGAPPCGQREDGTVNSPELSSGSL